MSTVDTLDPSQMSPFKKELCSILQELKAEVEKEPRLTPCFERIERSVNIRLKNPRHRVSPTEFVGVSEKANIIFQASEDFVTFKDKPDEIAILQKKLDDISSI